MKRTQLQRRTSLRAMSAKRRHALAQRKRVRRIVIERDGGCVGKRVWPEVECDGPLEVDELRGGATGRYTFENGIRAGRKGRRGGYQGTADERREAMAIDWMNGREINQAIPPAYTEYIGHQLMAHLEAAA